MATERTHQYRITSRWTGNLGAGTTAYAAYSRAHECTGAGKSVAIPGSSDPAFRGDPARYNPEELLVAALASCHMLWVLHFCADAGIVVTEYIDEAAGEMVEHADGSGEMTRVVLRPRLRITDIGRAAELAAIHHRAHAVCCMARSVRFPVEHEPVVSLCETHPELAS
jgi:organic hydroperoxide reductase OsmC/OhrA